jgi:hypothetical protein
MSNLPTVDALKASQRHIQKLSTQLNEGAFRETHLELLAEALRDERDAALAELADLKKQGEK